MGPVSMSLAVAGKPARSTAPSPNLGGGRHAMPVGAGPVAPVPPARTSTASDRLLQGRRCAICPATLQRDTTATARAARLAARAENAKVSALHSVNTDPFDCNIHELVQYSTVLYEMTDSGLDSDILKIPQLS
jgi:hypothetical protein